MRTGCVHYKFVLCAVVICGLLAIPALTSSEVQAFDSEGLGKMSATDTTPGVAQDKEKEKEKEKEARPRIPRPRVPSLPCCECLGREVQFNISTGQGSGAIDSRWKVNSEPAYITSPFPSWCSLPPAQWIQPVASPTPSPSVPPGLYKYTLTFKVPNCTIPINSYQLTGQFAADNSVTVFLDGQIAECPGPKCFLAGQPLNFNSNTPLAPGLHTLEFDVRNLGGPSGLLVNAFLKEQCGKEPTQ